jgi:hypothetical protein
MGVGCQRHAPATLASGKETRCPLDKRLGGPQVRSGRVRKVTPLLGSDPQIVQPVARRYTDYAVLDSKEVHK